MFASFFSHSNRAFQASPEFKGIKTSGLLALGSRINFKPALNSKGLRRGSGSSHNVSLYQASPEFKGIKTSLYQLKHRLTTYQASPEFKGIKTLMSPRVPLLCSIKPALNSKGLRHPTTLIARLQLYQASPEFKGIKTGSASSTCRPAVSSQP